MIIRHDIDPARYLVLSEQFPAVVVVESHLEEVLVGYDKIDQLLKPNLLPLVKTKPEFILCADGMGCLIRPDWILTAAHVARDLPEAYKIKIGEVAYAVQKTVVHPDYVAAEEMVYVGDDGVHNDIALIQLVEPVSAIAPLSLYGCADASCADESRADDELSQVATLVGSGDVGNGLIGPDRADGKLRSATNNIEQVHGEWLVFTIDAPPECTTLEGIAGPGDGGGPALLKVAGEWAIAGIRSGQSSPDGLPIAAGGEGRYGVREYYARIAYHLDWIKSVVD